MPRIDFGRLPGEARVWVFAADRELSGDQAAALLGVVDGFLDQWKAHGAPLTCARDWRDGRFLAIGVDQRAEGASGCSIDGLFRVFKDRVSDLGVSMLNQGMVYWRDSDGVVCASRRSEIRGFVENGAISAETGVFDTSLIDAAGWRERFEVPAAETWVLSGGR